MGILDLFLSEEKKILRYTRKLTHRDAQPEDREAAVVWLADCGTPTAIGGILSRFDMNLDHQLKDAGEKDVVFQVLAELGYDKIKKPLDVWLRRCRQFALPLRLLDQVGGRAAAVDMAFDLLQLEFEKDYFKPEKKHQLLVWLAETPDPRCVEAAAPFLKDFDEGVRYAAVELLYKQEGDAAMAPLVAVMLDDEEDSNRLKIRIAEVLVSKGWPVGEFVDDADRLPQGFALRAGKLVRS